MFFSGCVIYDLLNTLVENIAENNVSLVKCNTDILRSILLSLILIVSRSRSLNDYQYLISLCTPRYKYNLCGQSIFVIYVIIPCHDSLVVKYALLKQKLILRVVL